jgi:hypothetical protein
LELTHQIGNLQKLLDQRQQNRPNPVIHEDKQLTRETSAWRHPIAQAMQSRVSRQSVKGDTADKNAKNDSSQSASRNEGFSRSLDVSAHEKTSRSKNSQSFDQSQSSNKILSPDKLPDTAKTNVKSGQKPPKKSISRTLQLDSQAAEDESSDSSDGQNYHTECWPSTGDRRGNPKEDYDKHGKLRQPKPDTKRPHKRKSSNEFGTGTFWDRPAASKQKHNRDGEALMLCGAAPKQPHDPNVNLMTHDLIVDTGASHVLFQERHQGLLTNVQLSGPQKNPYAILRAATGQTLTAIGKGIFRIQHVSVITNFPPYGLS